MSEAEETDNVDARVTSHIRFSTVWLVPAVALVIGLWMIYSYYSGLGSLIEITFNSGDGIQAGTTKVRSKNVEIGEVLDLRLSEDAEHVVLSVRIFNHAEALLREDSQFWVVRPRIGAGGVTGLGTLLSGAFIELTPGTSDDLSDQFIGLDTPPVTPLGTPGLHVTLDSASNRPLHEGDPILFNGIEVGRIEYVQFNTEKRRTYYDAFIAAPYDHLVTDRTRFWFSSGFEIDLSPDGLSFEIASLSTLLVGGVAFDVPEGEPLGELITDRAYFTIYPNQGAISEMQYENALSFVILFDDSIRGLRPGAPVEFRGVKVGEVIRTDIDYPEITNLLEPDSKIPVLIDVEPARFGFPDSRSVLSGVEDRIDELIDSGLRAGLATGNILSGRKYIELRYEPGADGDVRSFANYKVIPSIDTQLNQLMANASRTLNAISKLPLDQVAESARIALDEFAVTLEEFRGTASGLEELLSAPGSDELLGTLNTTLMSFQELVVDFSEGSATNRELQQSLQALEQTFTELEPVLRNLRRQPNSLIFGGSDDEDPEPKGLRQ